MLYTPLQPSCGGTALTVRRPCRKVEIQIHALHGLPLHVLQGSPKERPQCKLRIHLGSELQETSWVDLTEDERGLKQALGGFTGEKHFVRIFGQQIMVFHMISTRFPHLFEGVYHMSSPSFMGRFLARRTSCPTRSPAA